jgi:hypothetical protein
MTCLLKQVSGLGLALPLQFIRQHGQIGGETFLLVRHFL